MTWRLRVLAHTVWHPAACRLCLSPVSGPALAVRGPQVDKLPPLPAAFAHLAGSLCPACLKAYAWPALDQPQPGGLWPGTPPLQGWIGPYAANARHLIHSLKYHRRADLAAFLGDLLALALAAPWRRPRLVVPIPLHPDRQRERGYNQAALIAAPIGTRLGWPVRNLLRRTRPTKTQAELDGPGRYNNLHGAFAAGPSIRGQRILLIDDVCTTGATLSAAAATCLNAGAAEVTAAVLFVADAGDLVPPVPVVGDRVTPLS